MSIITLPTAVRILRVDWGQRRYDLRFERGDAGAGQTRVLAPPRWTAGIVCPEQMSQADAAAWRDLILSLSGQVNQLALHDLGNPAPRGTMRGTLTLNTAVAAGDLVFSITGGAGQAATTLSGGEAQRVKLALELSKRDTGRTLYILDEPTTGLHFADIALLLKVLHQLRDAGNTIVIIEHNLDVIKTADWLIDMGPEGGSGGGTVVGCGTPEAIAAIPESFTGRYLARYL